MRTPREILCVLLLAFLVATPDVAMSQHASNGVPGYGPDLNLPKPQESWLPTLKWSTVKPWHEGAKPRPAKGATVNAFAKGLQHPRWLHILPNGDVLTAEAASLPADSCAIVQN